MIKKIKILHLIKSLGRGGAEKLIPETAKVHNQEKFDFYCLYFYHQENNIVDELEAAGIQVQLIPSGNLGLFFQVKKVNEFVKKHQIDLIHAHLPWAGILSRSVGKQIPIPIVYTEHNTWDRYNKVSYWGNRVSFKHQDIAIAVSNEVALSMKLNSMLDPYVRGGRLKVKVIQNGVNTDFFRRMGESKSQLNSISVSLSRSKSVNQFNSEAVEEKLINQSTDLQINQSTIKEISYLPAGELPPSSRRNDSVKSFLRIPESAPVIGKVAVFRSQKRLWLWVDLALQILKKCPETHFLLVGDGEWRARILEQVEKSGKSAHFHWVGVQKQVIPYLSIMDIYLSTSEFEGLPIAMLEAMSCEVPVVATSAGGIGEIVQHGVQGFLTPIEDYADLAEYAVELLQNPDLRSQFAQAARERVVQEFSMKRMVKELEGVYEEVNR